ncbi:MAG: deoxyribonuclease IV [Armatimonadetes bacterium]|nr:deoxyribonuclease IV [Armatimonadota bacterium]
MPTAGGVHTGIERGDAIGATAIQIFTTSPRQWKARELTDEVLEKWNAAKAKSPIQAYVSHDSYLVDLSSNLEENRTKSVDFLVGELTRCHLLGIPNVVSHMGSGKDEELGCKLIAENLLRVLAETPNDVTLLMETTAGQGSDLGYKFEQWARVIELAGNPDRLAICLDTCHIFAAGYDIRTAETYAATFEEFDRIIGIPRIRAIHCNDSKKDLGTRVDRHDAIGKGFIGETAFRCLVNDPRFINTPILLETPDAETMHAVNLATLRSYVEG